MGKISLKSPKAIFVENPESMISLKQLQKKDREKRGKKRGGVGDRD